jgi:hypothetical protein
MTWRLVLPTVLCLPTYAGRCEPVPTAAVLSPLRVHNIVRAGVGYVHVGHGKASLRVGDIRL